MEGRLIIFLAFVAVTLFVNTVIILMVFKTFGDLAMKVTDEVHELQTSASTKQWLASAQAASETAAKVSGVVRDQLVELGPKLERMQVEHAERLARADVRLKLVFRAIDFTSEKLERIVKWPIRNIQAASSVIKGIFEFIRGTESGSDARSRRTR